ncbi:hypothetical protein T440DRAFT_466183 [Plenodomus tracheiphilus IPT5]|uniref:Uncharacterized protein n=1 Tax=Plenodomus tracheiphilus IPT5 TaxID=1408161 RepID=A0A6A7BET1_9PLEO|nr:hypothetical protein T440DRAFT_466183 [Plenodomus tracheiphilus IPT5]
MSYTRKDSHGGDVVADINYFAPTGVPITTSMWKKPVLGEKDEFTRPMTIHDVRRCDKTFQLGIHGFQFIKLPPKQRITAEDGEEIIRRDYYPELEQIAKDLTGATTAHVFNHVIRAHSSPSAEGIQDSYGRWQSIPSSHPHVDYANGAPYIAGTIRELNLPPPFTSLFTSSTRFAFLGLWRPLKTVRRDPLAVCDATTVPDADYQIRLREFSRTGNKSANYVLSHGEEGERHMWYYMSEMRDDEMVVFKGFDTVQDEPGWRCPHTAFRLPGSEGEAPRESVEARVVCFWE